MSAYVIVSGAPGSGKSTLAEPLAKALGFPLLSKDVIKERLYDSLGEEDGDPLLWSRRLGAASMELIWTLAARFSEVVLEANFRPHSPYERSRIAGLVGRVVEVHCMCPPELAKARYAARARTDGHHGVHVLPTLSDDLLAEFDAPIGLGGLVGVDTTTAVDVSSVVRSVEAMLLGHQDDAPERKSRFGTRGRPATGVRDIENGDAGYVRVGGWARAMKLTSRVGLVIGSPLVLAGFLWVGRVLPPGVPRCVSFMCGDFNPP